MRIDDLIQSFSALGLRPGMSVIVHSSLKSFGYVEGGADTVINALMRVLTEEGTLMMPSFNHDEPYQRGEMYDIRKTPTKNGIIPDTFWRREGVLRSMNPTHPFAAWGKNARRYTEHHDKVDTMGAFSPLGLLFADGGYCLLLGVSYGSNTFHHCVETMEGAPCLSTRGEIYPMRSADGKTIYGHTWGWRASSCPIDDAHIYDTEMAPYHKQMKIGSCTATLYPLKDGYRVIARALSEGRGGNPPCSACPIRPRSCAYTLQMRPFTAEDFADAMALWQRTPGVGIGMGDTAEGIAAFVARNPSTSFAALWQGRMVGVILCGHDGRRGHIYHTAVDRDFRGLGIGRALVEHATDALRAEGIPKVSLVAFHTNETGNAFWESIGFAVRDDLIYRNRSLK